MEGQFILSGPTMKERVLDLVNKIRDGEGDLTEEVRNALLDTDPFLIESAEAELI